MITSLEQLNNWMGNPRWTDGQKLGIELQLAKLEGDLAARLLTFLDPVQVTETAPISTTGLLMTAHPVYSVMTWEGEPLTEPVAGPPALPTGWRHENGYLRRIEPASIASSVTSAVITLSDPFWDRSGDELDFDGGPGQRGGLVGRSRNSGSMTLTYLAGWGPDPTLVGAVLNKAQAFATNRYDDTVIARNAEAQRPVLLKEEWTESDIATLGRFRNITAWR
jgi:hypothetical protein